MNKKIAIIGGGNLGAAIAEGLVKSGFTLPEHIMVTKRNISTIRYLEEKGLLVGDDNREAVKYADLVILAVKPFQVEEVIKRIKDDLTEHHLLLSVVTGVSIDDILHHERWDQPQMGGRGKMDQPEAEILQPYHHR